MAQRAGGLHTQRELFVKLCSGVGGTSMQVVVLLACISNDHGGWTMSRAAAAARPCCWVASSCGLAASGAAASSASAAAAIILFCRVSGLMAPEQHAPEDVVALPPAAESLAR